MPLVIATALASFGTGTSAATAREPAVGARGGLAGFESHATSAVTRNQQAHGRARFHRHGDSNGVGRIDTSRLTVVRRKRSAIMGTEGRSAALPLAAFAGACCFAARHAILPAHPSSCRIVAQLVAERV